MTFVEERLSSKGTSAVVAWFRSGAAGLDLSALSPREQRIIERTQAGRNQPTLEEIGDVFNVGKERVRQLMARSIRQLRQANDGYLPGLDETRPCPLCAGRGRVEADVEIKGEQATEGRAQ